MITLEQVDQLRKRTNCSYEEAKALLEKHNGDVLEAIVDFEKSKNKKSYEGSEGQSWKRQGGEFWKKVSEVIQKGFDNRVVIEDKSGILLNVSINIMLLILIIPPFTIPVLLVLLLLMLLGYKISIKKKKGVEWNLSSMMKDVTDKFTGKATSQQQPQPPHEQAVSTEVKKDEYNEMTIE